jgi:formylglycine-generating enzyme
VARSAWDCRTSPRRKGRSREVTVDGFWMDRDAVTNEQFERFVAPTGYVTVAERPLKPEDFPGAPPENLVLGSMVF